MKREDWAKAVGEKVCDILEARKDDEHYMLQVLDALNKAEMNPDDPIYKDYSDEMEVLFEANADIESTAYKILHVINELIK
jgi:hypothetical protein